MKTPDIRRGIVSSRARQSGDSADIGKVARVRGSLRTEGKSRRRRRAERDAATSGRKVLFWSILLGSLSVAVIAVTLLIWLAPKLSSDDDEDSLSQMMSTAVKARIVSKFPSPSGEESMSLVKRVIENRDPVQVDALMWKASHSPEEIVAYFAGREQRDGPILSYRWLSSMDSGTLLMDGVMVASDNKGKLCERLAILTPDSEGHWKVDFDAFARTVTPSWTDLLEKGAEKGQVRVFVMPDMYYNASFADENQWECYALTTPDLDEALHGYCRKNSDLAATIHSLFTAENNGGRATLEIRRVAGGEPRQFEITKVIAKDWYVPWQPSS